MECCCLHQSNELEENIDSLCRNPCFGGMLLSTLGDDLEKVKNDLSQSLFWELSHVLMTP